MWHRERINNRRLRRFSS